MIRTSEKYRLGIKVWTLLGETAPHSWEWGIYIENKIGLFLCHSHFKFKLRLRLILKLRVILRLRL